MKQSMVPAYFFLSLLCIFLMVAGLWMLKNGETPEISKETTVILEYDGCKVYRFYDGAWMYFARCQNSSIVTTEYEIPSGKGFSPASISTVQENYNPASISTVQE